MRVHLHDRLWQRVRRLDTNDTNSKRRHGNGLSSRRCVQGAVQTWEEPQEGISARQCPTGTRSENPRTSEPGPEQAEGVTSTGGRCAPWSPGAQAPAPDLLHPRWEARPRSQTADPPAPGEETVQTPWESTVPQGVRQVRGSSPYT